jgi:hypothetical protein
MADRALFMSWGTVVRGREERALEVFNEVVGLYGRLEQEGGIESFDVVLLQPAPGVRGYVTVHGTGEQLAALQENEEWQRAMIDSELVVDDFTIVAGYANEGVARQIGLYQGQIAKVPQSA